MGGLFRYNYEFSLLKVLKQKKIWILGATYIFFVLLFLVIIPVAIGRSYKLLWNNNLGNGEMFLMYIGCIFIAIVVCEIYKTDIDNGTELLLCSKPLTRMKQCFTKLFVFLTFIFVFSLLTVVCALLAYAFGSIDGIECLWLSLSIYISSCVMFLLFGFIACFTCMYLNKVWTCLVNVILVTVFSVFSICNTITIYSPTQHLTSGQNYSLGSSKTLGYGENGFVENNSGFITNVKYDDYFGEPTLVLSGQYANNPYDSLNSSTVPDLYINIGQNDGQIFSINDAKKIWENANKKSKSKIANQFDLMQQFTLMNNSFGLEDETVHSNASSFGSKSQFYQYNIDDNILSDKNFHSPLFFVNGSVDTTTSPLLNNPIGWIISNLLSQSIITLGNASNYQLGIDISQFTNNSVNNFDIAQGNFKNKTGNSYKKSFNEKSLWPTEEEQADFKKITQTIFDNFLKDNKLILANGKQIGGYGGNKWIDTGANALSYDINDFPTPQPATTNQNLWSGWFEYKPVLDTNDTPYTDGVVIHNFYDYIHYLLLKSPHINAIVNDDCNKLLTEVLKFKFYLFWNLIYDTPRFTGQAQPWKINDINNNILNNKFLLPVDRTESTTPSDTPDSYSNGTVIMPYYDQTNGNGDYSENFANYYSTNPIAQFNLTETTINPYYGWTKENGGNISLARSILGSYCTNIEEHGYDNATLKNESDPTQNPAILARRYFGSLITNTQNLFIQYERLNFNYTVSPNVNSYFYFIEWLFYSIILGIGMFITYYRKDFK